MKQPQYLPSFGRCHYKRRISQHHLLSSPLEPYLFHPISEMIQPLLGQHVVLEIGFGSGEFLLHQAQTYPEKHFIGCEVFLDGIVSLVRQLIERSLENIRIFNQDARLLIDHLPKAFANEIYVLFPDPWPKRKHHKRRLIQQNFLTSLSHILKASGRIYIATDHQDYAEWIFQNIQEHPQLNTDTPHLHAYQHLPSDLPMTKYRAKSLDQPQELHYWFEVFQK